MMLSSTSGSQLKGTLQKGTPGSVCKMVFHHSGRGARGNQWVEARKAAHHPPVHRTAPCEDPAPLGVSTARAQALPGVTDLGRATVCWLVCLPQPGLNKVWTAAKSVCVVGRREKERRRGGLGRLGWGCTGWSPAGGVYPCWRGWRVPGGGPSTVAAPATHSWGPGNQTQL